MQKETYHTLKLGEGNITLCGKPFSMTPKGWELKFTFDDKLINCEQCLDIKNTTKKYTENGR